MDALLEPVPDRIETPRLIIRPLCAADAAAHNAAVVESLAELRPYMPWAQSAPSLEYSEGQCRRLQALFLLRDDLSMGMFERSPGGAEGGFVGGVGLHRIDWVVRRFELGYWCRSGRVGSGLVAEAADALTQVAFEQLRARRVEVRMDDGNERSRRVAERAGFTFEGLLRQQKLSPSGEPRDTRLYAKTRPSIDA